MKSSTFNVCLVNRPFKESNKGKNKLNRIHLCNMSNGLSVVDSLLLRESFHKKTRFVTLNNTIRGKFSLVNPSTFNNILFGRARN